MSEPDRAESPATDVSTGERVIDALFEQAEQAAPHELPGLLAEHAPRLGVLDPTIYLVDLQQVSLTPFLGQDGPGSGPHPTVLLVDSTVAGRAYQHEQVMFSPGPRAEPPCGCRCATAPPASASCPSTSPTRRTCPH